MACNLFRLIALALLVFAVPVQGMAAVVGGQCMALQHHDAADSGHGHSHDGGDGHDHDGHDHDGHSHDNGGDGGKDGNKPHCGPCSGCCGSASIAGPVGLSIAPSLTHAKYAFSQLQPPAVQPDGLDRPPLAL